MSFIDKTLLNNERILYRAKMHWVIFLFPVFWTVLTSILMTQPSILQLLAFVTAIVAVINWLTAFVSYQTSEYGLTNKRVLVKVGFIKRQSLEIFLQKIEGIKVNQSIFGRFFGYGTIIIIGTGGTQNFFSLIQDPLVYRKKVQEQIEKVLQS